MRPEASERHPYREIWRLAIPSVTAKIFSFASTLITLAFIGRGVGTVEAVATASVCLVFYQCTGIALAIGMTNVMDTLATQAVGAGDLAEVGLVFQRGVVCLHVAWFFVAAVFWFGEAVFLALQFDAELSRTAGAFLRCLIPAVWAYMLQRLIIRTLVAQRIVRVTIWVGVISCATVPATCWLFIVRLECGINGAALAISGGHLASLLMYLILVRGRIGDVTPASAESFPYPLGLCAWQAPRHLLAWEGLCAWLRVAANATVSTCAETWTVEGLLMIVCTAPWRTGMELARHSILSNTVIYLCVVWGTSISMATSTTVGQAVGAYNGPDARASIRANLVVGAAGAVGFALVLVLAQSRWGALFSADPRLVGSIGAMIPYAAAVVVARCLTGVCAAVCRGLGFTDVPARANLAGHWLVTLPAASLLGRSGALHLGLEGVWMGWLAGQSLILCGLMCFVVWAAHTLEDEELLAHGHHPRGGRRR